MSFFFATTGRCVWRHERRLRTGKELCEVVVHAGHPEVRLAVEGSAEVVHALPPILEELDEREDEALRLVE